MAELLPNTNASTESTAAVALPEAGNSGSASHRGGVSRLLSSVSQASHRLMGSGSAKASAVQPPSEGVGSSSDEMMASNGLIMPLDYSHSHDIAKLQEEEQASAGEAKISKAAPPPRSRSSGSMNNLQVRRLQAGRSSRNLLVGGGDGSALPGAAKSDAALARPDAGSGLPPALLKCVPPELLARLPPALLKCLSS